MTDPFSKEEEEQLGWYFEQYLYFPDKGATAQLVAATVPRYGESLFRQLFAEPEAYSRYKEALQSGIAELRFEVAGLPQFHGLHWEALKDPKLPDAFVLHTTMVRKNLTPQTLQARVKDSPTINVLLIVARPHGRLDVGYRTISRPLVECLRQEGQPRNSGSGRRPSSTTTRRWRSRSSSKTAIPRLRLTTNWGSWPTNSSSGRGRENTS